MRRILPLLLLLIANRAAADIAMVDVNDRPEERATVASLASGWGADSTIVRGDTSGIESRLEDLFAKAEHGEGDLDMLVLSGHNSSGRDFYSHDGTAHLSYETLRDLSTRYPHAFSHVRHLVLLGCMAGSEEDSQAWQDLFPEILTVSGFDGIGPSDAAPKYLKNVLGTLHAAVVKAGGEANLARALDDEKTRAELTRALETLSIVNHTNWSFRVCGDFHTRHPVTKSDGQTAKEMESGVFVECLQAAVTCADPSDRHDELSRLYVLERRLEHEPAFQADTARIRARRVDRLDHYPDYIARWDRENANAWQAGRAALAQRGITVPAALAAMKRAEMKALEARIATLRPSLPESEAKDRIEELARALEALDRADWNPEEEP